MSGIMLTTNAFFVGKKTGIFVGKRQAFIIKLVFSLSGIRVFLWRTKPGQQVFLYFHVISCIFHHSYKLHILREKNHIFFLFSMDDDFMLFFHCPVKTNFCRSIPCIETVMKSSCAVPIIV